MRGAEIFLTQPWQASDSSSGRWLTPLQKMRLITLSIIAIHSGEVCSGDATVPSRTLPLLSRMRSQPEEEEGLSLRERSPHPTCSTRISH